MHIHIMEKKYFQVEQTTTNKPFYPSTNADEEGYYAQVYDIPDTEVQEEYYTPPGYNFVPDSEPEPKEDFYNFGYDEFPKPFR